MRQTTRTGLIDLLCIFLLAMLVLAIITACDVPPSDGGPTIAIEYQADFYTCGEPPDDTLFTCRTGTGPPRTDCTANGSGTTTIVPMTC